MKSLQSRDRLFIIDCVQVCAVSLSRTVARCGKAIIEVKRPALYVARGQLKVHQIADIAEVNQFWRGDLRLGIKQYMLEAGATVDFRFLICDLVESRD